MCLYMKIVTQHVLHHVHTSLNVSVETQHTLIAHKNISARTGKRVSSETKTVMCNIYNYFNKLSSKGGIVISCVIRTIKAAMVIRTTGAVQVGALQLVRGSLHI